MAHTPESRRRAWEKMQARRTAWFAAHGPCVLCGSTLDLQVDHVDPDTKVHHCVWSWKLERMLSELSKCQVLCKECHTAKTVQENNLRTGGRKHGTEARYAAGCRCAPCKEARKRRYWATKEKNATL